MIYSLPTLDILNNRSTTEFQDKIFEIKHLRQTAKKKEKFEYIEAQSIWLEVESKIYTLLNDSYFDIQLIVYFLETSLRTHGFLGLCESSSFFSDYIHKTKIEEIDFTLITYLNGQNQQSALQFPILLTPLFKNCQITFWDLQEIEKKGEPNLKKERSEVFNKHDKATFTSLAKQTMDSIKSCLNNFQRINDYVHSSTHLSATLNNVIHDLEQCLYLLSLICHEAEPTSSELIVTEPLSIPLFNEAPKHAIRENAIESIQAAIHYFKRYEPHSPIPYLLEKAVLWSSLNFPDLINELITDNVEKSAIKKFVGITSGEKYD